MRKALKLGKLDIQVFDVPDVNFDFLKAGKEGYIRYGLPSSESSIAFLKKKSQEASNTPRFIEPAFKLKRRRKIRLPELNPDHGPETMTTWSGAILRPPMADPLSAIHGSWTVPVAGLPADAQDGQRYCASVWIGLDGTGQTNELLQVGCDAIVTLLNGVAKHSYSPWFQWYPVQSNPISSIPISPGDVIDCVIELVPGLTSSASVYFSNRTTGAAHTFTASAPQGSSLIGNSAEWIVEANGYLGPLARYGTINFMDCTAGTTAGQTLNAASGDPINMVDSAQNVISTGSIVGQTGVTVSSN